MMAPAMKGPSKKRETPDRSGLFRIPSFTAVRGFGFVMMLGALVFATDRFLATFVGDIVIAGAIVFASGVIGPAIYNRR